MHMHRALVCTCFLMLACTCMRVHYTVCVDGFTSRGMLMQGVSQYKGEKWKCVTDFLLTYCTQLPTNSSRQSRVMDSTIMCWAIWQDTSP